MGRDYWSWGRSTRKPASGAGTPVKYKHSVAAAPAGCLSGALQVFDLHRLLFTAARSSGASLSPDREYCTSSAAAELLKGVEAPRNSLELDPVGVPAVATTSAASLLSGSGYITADDDDFEIPFAIQVAPRRDRDSGDQATTSSPRPQAEDPRSSVTQSRGSTSGRNTNVVAKLMGLDLLPDQAISPRTRYANRDALLSPPPARVRSRLKRASKLQENHQQPASGTHRTPLLPRSCNGTAMEDDMRHGTRSLPDTPRMSASSARPSWDSETPRHSLQSHACGGGGTHSFGWNRENMSASAMRELKSICEDYSALEPPTPPRPPKVSVKVAARGKENCPPKVLGSGIATAVMSPRRYAREIVRQAKDSVARRISGNSTPAGSSAESAAPVVRSERRLRASSSFSEKSGREGINCSPSPRCSPRVESPRSNSPHSPLGEFAGRALLINAQVHAKPQLPPPYVNEQCGPPPALQQRRLMTTGFAPSTAPTSSPSSAMKKASYERFTERLKKPVTSAASSSPSKREARMGPSSSPLSSPQRMRNCIIRPPSKLRIQTPAALTTSNLEMDDDQAAAFCSLPALATSASCPRPPHRLSRSPPPPAESDQEEEEEELRYVKCVLDKAGIRPDVPVPHSQRWHSASHPLDPAIFHHLELSSCSLSPRGPLQRRCNRKLLFNLVDELLSDILWPQLQETAPTCPSAAVKRPMMTGDALLRRVWSQSRSYPAADCHVIQDIDALVGMDLTESNVRGIIRHPAVAEEAGCVASELEAVIMDSLLADAATAASEGGSRIGSRQQRIVVPAISGLRDPIRSPGWLGS